MPQQKRPSHSDLCQGFIASAVRIHRSKTQLHLFYLLRHSKNPAEFIHWQGFRFIQFKYSVFLQTGFLSPGSKRAYHCDFRAIGPVPVEKGVFHPAGLFETKAAIEGDGPLILRVHIQLRLSVAQFPGKSENPGATGT